MNKKTCLWVCACLIILLSQPLFARTWYKQPILLPNGGPGVPFYCGKTPSMALLYGVQPVVSNYMINSTGTSTVRRNPFGWESFSVGAVNGFIANNGSNQIVANNAPITIGADGQLYSYIPATGAAPTPTSYRGGSFVTVGPTWSLGSGPIASVSADYYGKIYMAAGKTMGSIGTSTWTKPNDPLFTTAGQDPFDTVSQIAVSPFGEVAISGYKGTDKKVVWYDFKLSAWNSRILAAGSGTDPLSSIALGWDPKGNLAVAYSDGTSSSSLSLNFDYLDLATDLWTKEVLDTTTQSPYPYYLGTALAFDRFGNPVVASGSNLFYDPILVPEPISFLCFGLGLCMVRRFRSVV